MKDPSPDMVSDLEQNAHIIAPSESQEEILHPNGNSAMDGGTSSEAIHASLSNFDPEPPSESLGVGSESVSVDVQSSSVSEDNSGDSDMVSHEFDPHRWPLKVNLSGCTTGNLIICFQDIAFPEVTISGLTETSKVESSIKVPLQQSYTGRYPIIPSSLADTPCNTLGVQGVLDGLNTTLRMSYTLDTPSLHSILEDCIEKEYDFGTAYGHLRRLWYTCDCGNIQDQLRRQEEKDREMRWKALEGNRIINPELRP